MNHYPKIGQIVDFFKARYSLTIVAIVHLIFLFAFAPNVGGDAINYLNMIRNHSSNLIHAPGYAFLMSQLKWLGVERLQRISMGTYLQAVVCIQHLIFMLCLTTFFRMVKKLATPSVAHLATLLFGLHPSVMANLSMFYPEWLQVSLLTVAIAVSLQLQEQRKFVKNFGIAGVGGFLFASAYLTKFNSAYMALVFIAIFIIVRVPWVQKVALLIMFFATSLITIQLFQRGPHFASTGTRQLNFDHGWILLYKVGEFIPRHDPELLKEIGIHGQRLLALNSVLPESNDNAYGLETINAVSKDVASYRQKFLWILSADSSSLSKFLETAPRKSKWNWYYAFSPISYYIGIKESDDLGIAVFFEAVRYHFFDFLTYLARQFWFDITSNPVHVYLPETIDTAHGFNDNGKGLLKFDESHLKRDGNDVFANPEGYWVRQPWAGIFILLFKFGLSLPCWTVSLLCGLGAMISFQKNRDLTPFVVLIFLAGFIICSDLPMTYRWDKEMILGLPWASYLVSIAVIELQQRMRVFLNARFAKL